MPQDQIHSSRSSHREALLEHLFAGAVMKHLWTSGVSRLEVLKPQVDDSGYDLVLEAHSIVRHVQLKSSFRGSKVRHASVNALLAAKPSGCMVFMWFDPKTLELGPFAFFGGRPRKPLPDISSMKLARHTKANAQGVKAVRPNVREVPLSKFERVATIEELVVKLFGRAPANNAAVPAATATQGRRGSVRRR
jgi:hypothetical protein